MLLDDLQPPLRSLHVEGRGVDAHNQGANGSSVHGGPPLVGKCTGCRMLSDNSIISAGFC